MSEWLSLAEKGLTSLQVRVDPRLFRDDTVPSLVNFSSGSSAFCRSDNSSTDKIKCQLYNYLSQNGTLIDPLVQNISMQSISRQVIVKKLLIVYYTEFFNLPE